MMRDIMTVYMTQAELARDVHAVLEKVRQAVASKTYQLIAAGEH